MRKPIWPFIRGFLAFIILCAFTLWFGGPAILKSYIKNTIGTCDKIPILCSRPSGPPREISIDKNVLKQMLPYTFPAMQIRIPKGFTVVNEEMKKIYYKKDKLRQEESVVYLLYKPPNFFINLFPQLRSLGVLDDYEFFRRTMNANIDEIKNVYDALFVVIKAIFIPNLGNQRNVTMAEFFMEGKSGFVNYNARGPVYYFDCNIFNKEGHLFKVYIRDKRRQIDLAQFMQIIASVKRPE